MKLVPASEEQERRDLEHALEAALTALPGDAVFLFWWPTAVVLHIRPMSRLVCGPLVINLSNLEVERHVRVSWPARGASSRYFTGSRPFTVCRDADRWNEVAELVANLLAYGTPEPGAVDRLAALSGCRVEQEQEVR